MIFAQKEKRIVLVNQAMTSAGTVAATFDSRGFGYVNVEIYPGVMTTNLSVCKIGQGDTSTAFTDIDELVGDGASGFVIPAVFTAMTDAEGLSSAISLGINVGTGKYKRFFKLSCTAPAAGQLCAVARLSKAETAPDTDAESGCAEIVNI